MSEPRLISPILDDFDMGESFSNHHGVRCCPAMPKSSDSKYIVKIISIPASQVQLQALLLTGACQSEDAARDYFHELAQGVAAESDILTRLSKLEGFLPYEACQIVPMEGETGFDVYLLSPYRKSLARHFRKNAMTHLGAVNLGLDMCASLAVCRQAGYLYADLKPENIFICNDKEYRIGDLGFLKLDALKYASLPDRYISSYTAPEIVDAFSDVNPTIDIYAAGLILYQAYNGGVRPFRNRAPAEPLPPPAYADYEMAEIILKACAPDPKDRWEDPITMGQAIVSYMQRNGANDTPIVAPVEDHSDELPSPVSEEPEDTFEEETVAAEDEVDADQIFLEEFYALCAEDEPEEASVSAEETDAVDEDEDDEEYDEDDSFEEENAEEDEEESEDEELLNLSFLDQMEGDDTAPSEDMADTYSYGELSQDASSILSLADDLISHETPEGVIPPKPVKLVLPKPVMLDPEPEEPEETETAEEPEAQPSVLPEKPVMDAATKKVDAPIRETSKEEDPEDYYDPTTGKKSSKKWIAVILTLLLLAGLAFGGYIFYRDYYLRSVTSLHLSGSEDELVVSLTANVDESFLTIICTDTHGTSMQSPVKDGKAVFTGLNPNTLYNVKVEVSGLRKLTGETSDSYTTPVQTNIIAFSAVTGTEEGSVILSFTVDGMDSDTWTVTYSAEGVEEEKVIFSGHTVNIDGLIPGKTYSFLLQSGSDLYVTGVDTLEHTVLVPVFAEELAIIGCTENSLQVQWKAPEGAVVESWAVRCYSDSGYDQTIITSDTTVTFTGLNGNEAHTVEVTASGMSTGTRCYLTANAVTVKNVNATKLTDTSMALTWEYTGNTPTGQWIVTYTVDNAAHQDMVLSSTNSAVISPMIPGASYTVEILLDDGTTVFTEAFTTQAPEADPFSGYLLSSETITASMCFTPAKSDWSHNDLTDEDYTSTFTVGDKASVVFNSGRAYDRSDDVITTMFVIHSEDGTLISSSLSQETWTNMWYKRYCEMDVHALPDIPGNYKLTIYFNGDFVSELDFEMISG